MMLKNINELAEAFSYKPNSKEYMFEEKIFQTLKSKITDGGKKTTSVSDKTIMAEAKRVGKKITEESQIELEIVDSLELLAEIDGNISFVAADAARKAKEGQGQQQQQQQQPNAAPAIDEETQKMLKTILENQKSQQEKESAAQKAAALKLKLEDVDKLLKSKGATHDKIRQTTLALNQFDESLTAEQIAEKALPLYNKEYTEFFGDSAAPKSASLMSDEQKKTLQAEAMKVLEKNREKLAPKPRAAATV